jgi:hypothetical protein
MRMRSCRRGKQENMWGFLPFLDTKNILATITILISEKKNYSCSNSKTFFCLCQKMAKFFTTAVTRRTISFKIQSPVYCHRMSVFVLVEGLAIYDPQRECGPSTNYLDETRSLICTDFKLKLFPIHLEYWQILLSSCGLLPFSKLNHS